MDDRQRLGTVVCPQCGDQLTEKLPWFEKQGTSLHQCGAILEFDLKEILRREADAKSGRVDPHGYLEVRLVKGKGNKAARPAVRTRRPRE